MRLRPRVHLARYLDEQLASADQLRALELIMPRWSKLIRSAIGLTSVDMANRLEISQPALSKLERNEQLGTISVAKLEELAKALDCRLIYCFIPNEPFSATATRLQAQQQTAWEAHRKMPRLI